MVAIVTAVFAAPMIQQYQASKDQKKAQEAEIQQAAKLAAEQERELNRVNQKKPNIASLLTANTSTSNTMLTGSTGIDSAKLKLSKTSLLGG